MRIEKKSKYKKLKIKFKNNKIQLQDKKKMEQFILNAIGAEKACYDEKTMRYTRNDDGELRLPINKLHGISVDATIYLRTYNYKRPVHEWTYFWLLKIRSDELYHLNGDEDDDDESFYEYYYANTSQDEKKEDDIAGLIDDLEGLIKSIKNLRFDKKSGKFSVWEVQVVSQPHVDASRKAFELLKGDENIETDYDECSVCYELTITQTGCDHRVCIPCISKIKRSRDDEGALKCPVCRETFFEIH